MLEAVPDFQSLMFPVFLRLQCDLHPPLSQSCLKFRKGQSAKRTPSLMSPMEALDVVSHEPTDDASVHASVMTEKKSCPSHFGR